MNSSSKLSMVFLALMCFALSPVEGTEGGETPSVASYPSIQAAIDANPGKMILVPPGDYTLTEAVTINKHNTGLYGFGTLIQTNPEKDVINIQNANGIRIEGLTLERPEGKMETSQTGVWADHCEGLALRGLRIRDNRTESAAIQVIYSTETCIENCEITNYKRIAIDDRTDDPETQGYAFHCINGTGIIVKYTQGAALRNNRIIESNLLPTKEVKELYNLGKLTEGKRPSKPGRLAGAAFRNGFVNNWHQGSALLVSSPENTSRILVTGNYIENAAQGIDLHCDQVICTNNIVNHGMMGVKMTHGCRNIIVTNNILSHIDLWAILLNPGAASHPAEAASEGKPAHGANVDAGTLIANNIISDYGFGDEYWNWGGNSKDQGGSYAIALFEGQLPENPPLRDVLVQGNIVYDNGRDAILVDGQPQVVPPRYRYAVYVGLWSERGEKGPAYPVDIHFQGNLFHPGTKGISNVELTP